MSKKNHSNELNEKNIKIIDEEIVKLKREKEKNAQDIEDIEKRLTSCEEEHRASYLDMKKNKTSIEKLNKDAFIVTEATSKLSHDFGILRENIGQSVQEK